MRKAALDRFLAAEIAEAREQDVLFSIHLKATMMRVSDPIIFGHAVRAFFPELDVPGWSPNDGLGALPAGTEIPWRDDRPALAMVDSDRGITNLHVPSDVIIDASMPAAIRSSGQMWNAEGEQQDTKFVIPDHSYAPLYAAAVDHCREHGAFDPATMGTTPNVGLMAQAAEEYGSHDKTFEITEAGVVRVVGQDGATLLEHEVEQGDIWRMCQTKDAPIQDWIRLAIARARETGWPAVFWLDETRAHDAQLLDKLRPALQELDTEGLQIEVLDVASAARYTLERARAGENTISVTGNVLRDYLTDLFPILELGTSAKMQSIVPLMAGGGLFETGAGGSAPKHVQQFLREDHLRWDSLGEFLALGPSLELLAEHDGNPRARLLADTLDRAIGSVLEENRSPSRKTGELDNRGSHFYLALYWARELAGQESDPELAERFAPLAERLAEDERRIIEELDAVQGAPVAIGGYYLPDPEQMTAAMRPSATFNAALESL
jgi:isocitrate dehydrogenase